MKAGNHDQKELLLLLKSISSRLKFMEERLEAVQGSSENMDQHINFIEGLYNTIKWPFFKLLSAVQFISVGSGSITPPKLTECNVRSRLQTLNDPTTSMTRSHTQ
jgi:hypothetical protein